MEEVAREPEGEQVDGDYFEVGRRRWREKLREAEQLAELPPDEIKSELGCPFEEDSDELKAEYELKARRVWTARRRVNRRRALELARAVASLRADRRRVTRRAPRRVRRAARTRLAAVASAGSGEDGPAPAPSRSTSRTGVAP